MNLTWLQWRYQNEYVFLAFGNKLVLNLKYSCKIPRKILKKTINGRVQVSTRYTTYYDESVIKIMVQVCKQCW